MKIAIVHENWDAGAARCARDLERGLAASHEVVYFPRDGCSSADQILSEIDSFRPDVDQLPFILQPSALQLSDPGVEALRDLLHGA